MNNNTEICAGFEAAFNNQLIRALQDNSLTLESHKRYLSRPLHQPSTALIQKANVLGFNCEKKEHFFFQALATQLDKGIYSCLSAETLMQIAVKHIIQGYQPTHYGKENFMRNVKQNGTGINHLAMSILASALDVSIFIVKSNASSPKHFAEQNPITTIYLGYDDYSQRYYLLNRAAPTVIS